MHEINTHMEVLARGGDVVIVDEDRCGVIISLIYSYVGVLGDIINPLETTNTLLCHDNLDIFVKRSLCMLYPGNIS